MAVQITKFYSIRQFYCRTIFVYRYIENVEEYAQQFALALPIEDRIKRIEMIKSGVKLFKSFLNNKILDLPISKAFVGVKSNVFSVVVLNNFVMAWWGREKILDICFVSFSHHVSRVIRNMNCIIKRCRKYC